MKTSLLAIVAICACAAAGCSSSNDTSTAPALSTTPTTGQVTENFSGTVQPGGNDASHSFTVVLANDAIAVDMTAVGPPATIAEGLGVGQNVGGTCQLISGGFGTFQASTTAQLSGTIGSGVYCLMVYDVGNQTAPVTYTVTVTHY